MSVVLITGSAGLVGSEAVLSFANDGFDVVGIDNDMRGRFFGEDASTAHQRARLQARLGRQYTHLNVDIRSTDAIAAIFRRYGSSISAVIHTAAQPSHDWAARDPMTDFGVNATGTLNLLEAARLHCPTSAFVFTSTNKVYGDRPNSLPLVEYSTRWELEPPHEFSGGVSEAMSIDQTLHSLFGASKVAADIYVQEYGRYFDLPSAVFRGGCLTGPNHAGAKLHGFLAYLMKCTSTGTPYEVLGYKGKQVRDNIHAADLVDAFRAFVHTPRIGEVYNIGGGRHSNSSLLEAAAICESIAGRELETAYVESPRVGDHKWWITDTSKFERHYPQWRRRYDIRQILTEIYEANIETWMASSGQRA